MTKPIKLTKPQKELLVQVLNGQNSCAASYSPAMKLVGYGYCTSSTGKFGGHFLHLTDFGKRKAEDLQRAKEG